MLLRDGEQVSRCGMILCLLLLLLHLFSTPNFSQLNCKPITRNCKYNSAGHHAQTQSQPHCTSPCTRLVLAKV